MSGKKKTAKKRAKSKPTVSKKKTNKKKTARKATASSRASTQKKKKSAGRPVARRRIAPRGGQSGDLQQISRSARADSESVDELLEEGNAFEAGVVSGVQEAEDTDRAVRTREVLEDDVPGEYLDKD